MKTQFLLLSLLAVAPVASLAQPQKSSLQVVVAPEAKTLLDGVTATYHAAKAVRFKLVEKERDASTTSSVSFQKPNLLRVEKTKGTSVTQLIADGKGVYIVQGTTYKRSDSPQEVATLWQSQLNNGTGFLMAAMLKGRSPVAVMQEAFADTSSKSPKLTVKVPPPAVVDGMALHGVKMSVSADLTGKGVQSPMMDVYVWFGADGLLSRISTTYARGRTTSTTLERISEQELDPTFAPDTFKFNATGLKEAVEAPEAPEFDPRLKVGAMPIAFSAKNLAGQAVAPANFKGKVLLLDFWATWCGPCVGAMPELKSVYSKYHPKGLEVVGISLDEDQKALTSFIKTNKMPWSQVYDGKGWNARVPGLYGVQAIPFMLIIGKDGKIAAVNPRDDLEGAVKKALAAK